MQSLGSDFQIYGKLFASSKVKLIVCITYYQREVVVARWHYAFEDIRTMFLSDLKGKGFLYSLPSVGPEADPSVQAVNPQVT